MLTWERIVEAEDAGDERPFADMCAGIRASRKGRALIVRFPDEGFRALSNGYHNGGFMDSPEAIVDLTSLGGSLEWDATGSMAHMNDMISAYMRKLGLDPSRTMTLETAASMDNASVGSVDADGIMVSAAVTAGIRGNAGCAGDPASYDEADNHRHGSGTIVIVLTVDADMTDAEMLSLMAVAAQAKSSAIEELQARSLYSHRVATGSGTDQTAIACRRGSGRSVPGIEIGSGFCKAVCGLVRQCLFDAFDRQSMMTMDEQRNLVVQLSRFGIPEMTMGDEIRFTAPLRCLLAAKPDVYRDPYAVAMYTAAMRLQDAVDAGRMDGDVALGAVKRMVLRTLGDRTSRSGLDDLRLDEIRDIPNFLSLFLALMLERRSSEIWREGRRCPVPDSR